ncbi:MAG: NAD(P)-dependent alcohol dehydrogenase [Parachlamydiales bacterium]
MKVQAYAAMEKGAELVPFEYEAGALGPHEVEVEVSHCGLCHSDLHLIDNDWGFSRYPLVPGHEVAGRVAQVGAQVKEVKVGERVGIGWQCASCLHCEWCRRGEENLCKKSQPTALGHYGGFANRVRAHERFAIPIPEGLPSEAAGPLLCGGITVYSPMHLGEVTPNQHVAILGVGGLGHMAIQFYHAFGCEVTALSSSRGKEEEAKRLGADHFVVASEAKGAQFDLILFTASVGVDFDHYLSLLRPKGKFCVLGAPEQIVIRPMSLIGEAKQMFGSPIGGPLRIREMLAFAARHEILPQIERFPMSRVNEAIGRLRENKVRYRAVLEING